MIRRRLLAALGEYAIRVGPPEHFIGRPPEWVAADPQTIQAHIDLHSFCALWKAPKAAGGISDSEFVFDADERRSISTHKYVGAGATLSKKELVGLLDALTRYARHAREIEQLVRWGESSG